uniref:A disintegrin and metalloproteinase with thrombospondin motifs 18 n=2 Tax=Cacopsylla melanoneura TaxID=428564 RepID=A0A8D8WU53_9HEMI
MKCPGLSLVICSVLGFCSAITKESLKELLSTTEWNFLIGTADPDHVDVVHLPHPRSHPVNTSHPVTLGDTGLVLHLTHNPQFAGSLVLSRNADNSTRVIEHRPECYFRSEGGSHRAALSMCDGMSGVILDSTRSAVFTIHPLPQRLHNASSSQHHHVLVKRSLPELQHNLDAMFNLQNFKFRRKGGKTNASASGESAEKMFPPEEIPQAAFVKLHPLSQPVDPVLKRESNKSALESKATISPSFIVSRQERSSFSVSSGRDYFDVERFKRSTGTTESVDWLTRNQAGSDWSNNESRRKQKREAPPPGSMINVETAVFVDKDLVQYMNSIFAEHTETELVKFVLTMVNAVQLLYHDPSLGWKVNFILKRLEILHSDPMGLTRSQNIDTFLSNFCTWQRTQNPDKDEQPLHWDHALILTGLDLYVISKTGKLSNQVVGLAPVAGMCTVTSSCTVNEGRHFESVYVVAHEIGHNLGMRHDGPQAGNTCDPSSYLMSPTLGSGKITWSSCSRQYLHKFLQSSQSQCLLDNASGGDVLDHSASGLLPGERFDANQQCMFRYGLGARHSPSQPLEEICQDLHCHRDKYTWTSHPALEGSICSNNKWCRSGRCVLKGLSASQAGFNPHQVIHGGWSEWSAYSECASACLSGNENGVTNAGVMIAGRRCNNPRPENGGNLCEGSDKKYQSCVPEQCSNVKETSVKNFADEVCTRAKAVDSELLGEGLQRISSDPEEACTVWCFKKQGGYKSRGWSFPDGTGCRMRNRRKSSFCINGICQEFVCSRFAHEGTLHVHSAEMCHLLASNAQLLFSRDKRRPVTPIASSQWVYASACHSNCISPGSGLRLVDRRPCTKCNQTTSIQLCKVQSDSCSRSISAVEYATKLCSKYSERVRRLSGLGVQLSPTSEDAHRPCRVACQDESVLHRFYLVNGEEGWLPFGTDCSRGEVGKKAFCVTGKCLEFGSDDTPLHDVEFTLPTLPRSR